MDVGEGFGSLLSVRYRIWSLVGVVEKVRYLCVCLRVARAKEGRDERTRHGYGTN